MAWVWVEALAWTRVGVGRVEQWVVPWDWGQGIPGKALLLSWAAGVALLPLLPQLAATLAGV
jgi:hypothetical protein